MSTEMYTVQFKLSKYYRIVEFDIKVFLSHSLFYRLSMLYRIALDWASPCHFHKIGVNNIAGYRATEEKTYYHDTATKTI